MHADTEYPVCYFLPYFKRRCRPRSFINRHVTHSSDAERPHTSDPHVETSSVLNLAGIQPLSLLHPRRGLFVALGDIFASATSILSNNGPTRRPAHAKDRERDGGMEVRRMQGACREQYIKKAKMWLKMHVTHKTTCRPAGKS